jgi:hypothetical protein
MQKVTVIGAKNIPICDKDSVIPMQVAPARVGNTSVMYITSTVNSTAVLIDNYSQS